MNVIALKPFIVFMNSFEDRLSVVHVRIRLTSHQLLSPLRFIVLLILLVVSFGCESLKFYAQAAGGQIEIIRSRDSVDELLQNPSVEGYLKAQLFKVKEIQSFAKTEIGLPNNGSYETYADLRRTSVVWNVFVAKPYKIQIVDQCFPIVGCVPYRGYFSKENALRHEQRQMNSGLDTYVGGVAAYSTLGWFKDSLLNTFINWEDQELARLIIHELLHQRIWIEGDAEFNEGLASFVGEKGSEVWLEISGPRIDAAIYRERRNQSRRFRKFVVLARQYLEEQFSRSNDFQVLEKIKFQAMGTVRGCYRDLKLLFGGDRYDALVHGDRFNNAFIASVGVYEDDGPAFQRLFHHVDGEWGLFFEKVESLAALDPAKRDSELNRLADEQITSQTDEEYPDQIHCESF